MNIFSTLIIRSFGEKSEIFQFWENYKIYEKRVSFGKKIAPSKSIFNNIRGKNMDDGGCRLSCFHSSGNFPNIGGGNFSKLEVVRLCQICAIGYYTSRKRTRRVNDFLAAINMDRE